MIILHYRKNVTEKENGKAIIAEESQFMFKKNNALNLIIRKKNLEKKPFIHIIIPFHVIVFWFIGTESVRRQRNKMNF